jgi:hypothetical protein
MHGLVFEGEEVQRMMNDHYVFCNRSFSVNIFNALYTIYAKSNCISRQVWVLALAQGYRVGQKTFCITITSSIKRES